MTEQATDSGDSSGTSQVPCESCNGTGVELFCRSPRFGWDSWGKGYESAAA